MLRGTTTFTCDKCGNKFEAPNMEYMAVALTMPQPCPECGSRHTYPKRFFGLNKAQYIAIWDKE